MNEQIFSEKHLRLLATGQGLFETILFKEGLLWFFEQHEQRLARSLEYFNAHYCGVNFRDIITNKISFRQADETLRIKLIILFPFNASRKELNEENVLFQIIPEKAMSETISLKTISSPFNRKCALLEHKTINYGYQFYMQSKANELFFDDILYFDELGYISESSFANFFAIKKDRIITPPLVAGVLPGTIRQILIDRLNISEEQLNISQLAELDGAFVTNSIREIQFVNKIDCINYSVFPEQFHLLLKDWKKIKEEYADSNKYLLE